MLQRIIDFLFWIGSTIENYAISAVVVLAAINLLILFALIVIAIIQMAHVLVRKVDQ